MRKKKKLCTPDGGFEIRDLLNLRITKLQMTRLDLDCEWTQRVRVWFCCQFPVSALTIGSNLTFLDWQVPIQTKDNAVIK